MKGDARTSFLLRPAAPGAELCAGCHASHTAVTVTPHNLAPLAESRKLPADLPDPRRAGVCGACHRVHGGDTLYLWPSRQSGTGARVDLCESCHAPGKVAAGRTVTEHSHPMGVSPGQDIGPDLPLYALSGRPQPGGRIACSTCHDAHRLTPTNGSGNASKSAASFLRIGADSFAPLCFPCHAEQSMLVGTDHDLRVTAPGARNRDGTTPEESGVCGVCHSMHGANGPIALWNRDLGEGKDLLSQACRGCHRPGDKTRARVPPRIQPHLVNYPGQGLVERIFTSTRAMNLEGASSIALYTESGVRTEKGYLSCASCHDVHRWGPDLNRSGAGVPVEGDITNSYLRVRSSLGVERSICRECHGDASQAYFRSYHFPEGK